MKRRIGFGLLTAALLTTPILTEAQQLKFARIGFLSNASPAAISARTEAFRQGLRELGLRGRKKHCQ